MYFLCLVSYKGMEVVRKTIESCFGLISKVLHLRFANGCLLVSVMKNVVVQSHWSWSIFVSGDPCDRKHLFAHCYINLNIKHCSISVQRMFKKSLPHSPGTKLKFACFAYIYLITYCHFNMREIFCLQGIISHVIFITNFVA